MYENDYILRMTRQMAEIIAALVLNKDIKNYDLCHEITNTALIENFGISKSLLLRLPVSSIKELVGNEATSKAVFFIAKLLAYEGDIFEKEGNKIQAEKHYKKSQELFDSIDIDPTDLG
ncbi:hypothetical protein GC105_12715 [Alkalibaculum sp. M08DMB]|uniref:Tetratricopeptide repeat protein n=1 Tax=Alkalibaculum sporogenes TaxID=2655001 RepID=A0A6A7KBK9_9FIRM|nr:DUF6483 family protein [Alkalibaculum sporogenes]MPW26651.1 hypothetical protein [Alkalibaculum sporogenes]